MNLLFACKAGESKGLCFVVSAKADVVRRYAQAPIYRWCQIRGMQKWSFRCKTSVFESD